MPVLRIEPDDPVIPVEGAEERDLQFADGRLSAEFRNTFGPVFDAVAKAPVDHFDGSIRVLRVFGGDAVHTALETVRQPGDFVPGAEVTRQLEAGDRRDFFRASPRHAASGENQQKQQRNL